MKTSFKPSWQISFTLILFLFGNFCLAQTKLQKAQAAAANYEYSKAIDLYLDCFNTTPAKPEEIRALVNCYSMVEDTKSAESWMAKLVSNDSASTNADILAYAKLLKSN